MKINLEWLGRCRLFHLATELQVVSLYSGRLRGALLFMSSHIPVNERSDHDAHSS